MASEIIIAGELTAIATLGTLVYLHHKSQGELLKTFWLTLICLTLFFAFGVLMEGLVIEAADVSLAYSRIAIQALVISFALLMFAMFLRLIGLIWDWLVGSLEGLLGVRLR